MTLAQNKRAGQTRLHVEQTGGINPPLPARLRRLADGRRVGFMPTAQAIGGRDGRGREGIRRRKKRRRDWD